MDRLALSPMYTLNTGGHAPTYRERKPKGWTRFYHSDYLLAFPLEETPYTFFSAQKIVIGLFGGSVSASKSKSVTWDRYRTQVVGARLGMIAHTDYGPSDYIISFNENDIYRKDFPLGLGQDDRASVDVTELLINGTNKVVATFEKPVGGATLTLTVTLYVEFSGVPPGKNPLDEAVIWVTEHPLESAGIAMAAVGGVILLRKKR